MAGPVIPEQRDGEPEPLTPRQHVVWEFIRDHVEMHGFPPSVREIGDAVGLASTCSVHHHLRMLRRKGWIRHYPNRTRAIALTVSEDDELIPVRLSRAEWRDVRRGLSDFWPATVGPLFDALERMDLGEVA